MAGKSLNKVQLIGTLGKDPEVRYTATGKAIANFSLATNESWKDKDGRKQERTDWHKIVAWGKLGEICGEYLVKGKSVYVEGRLQYNKWEDKEGRKRETPEININDMIMLGGKGNANNDSSYDDPPPSNEPEDDIPF